jgi:stage II sporulation protein D
VDCNCTPGPATRWTLELTADQLERALAGRGELKVVGRTATGRVRRIEIGGRGMSGVEFRQRLGYDQVRSLSFEVTPDRRGGARLTGRGFGHGAGLSQWGAHAMAEDGKDYRAILAHYPDTELQTLY